MSDILPWKTHHVGCPNRRPNVAYPRKVCDGCRMYEQAIDDCIAAVEARRTHIRRRNTAEHRSWFGSSGWYAVKILTVDREPLLAALRALKEQP